MSLRRLSVLTLLVMLGVTGCDAPLKPESKQTESTPTPSSAASAHPTGPRPRLPLPPSSR